MIQPDGAVKLADFGIARRVTAMNVTTTAGWIGSPHFMSPEQLRGQEATYRSDQYSLAVVAWILLTGLFESYQPNLAPRDWEQYNSVLEKKPLGRTLKHSRHR
jgi:serine/threonine protein kinase